VTPPNPHEARLREPHEDARLTAEEFDMVRGVLVACSNVLYWVERYGGPRLEAVLLEAEARSPGRLLYDVNLAIDYLDFACAAPGRTR
jgi:hypothetical protein